MGEGTPEPARTTTEEPRVEIGGSGEMHRGLPPSRRDDEPCAQTVIVAGDCSSALAAMTAISTIILLLQSQDPYNHNKALKKTGPRTLQAAELRVMKRNANGVASPLFSHSEDAAVSAIAQSFEDENTKTKEKAQNPEAINSNHLRLDTSEIWGAGMEMGFGPTLRETGLWVGTLSGRGAQNLKSQQ